MATPPLWLSDQDFSDDCHKVLQTSSAVSFQAAGSVQTLCEGAVFLTCIAWKPWFWWLGGNEDGFQHHRSSLSTHQHTPQKFLSLPVMQPTVPTTGHVSSAECWGRNGLSIPLHCSSSLSAWTTQSQTAQEERAATAFAWEDSQETPSLYLELSFWRQLYQARPHFSIC